MSLAVLFTALFVLFAIVLQSPVAMPSPAAGGDPPTAYSILQDYNFPVGILPKGVIRYDLDRTTGKFHAYFNSSCSFSLEGSYQLNYNSVISGYVSENKLTKLTGVSVKVLFVWLKIVEVVRNGNDLEFSIGIASANFGIENFYESPQCGCGFNCNGLRVRKIRNNPFVSSA